MNAIVQGAAVALLTCMTLIRAHAGEITLTGIFRMEDPAVAALHPSTDATGLTLMRAEKALPLVPGAALMAGDELRTGPQTAAQITLTQEHRILVMPGTRLRLGKLFLYFGEVLIRARGVFHIETSFMTAGVEGTEFLMRARDPGDKVDVIVTEGAVLCRSNAGLWNPVRVAAAEHLRAQSAKSQPDATNGFEGILIFRGPGNSKVQKAPARGSDLARIQMLGRDADAGRR